MKRRNFISATAAGTASLISTSVLGQKVKNQKEFKLKNNINHSVCQWCFNHLPLEDFLKVLNELGIGAIDLIGPKDWPLLKQYNIHCSMCNGAEISLTEGWNDPKYHEILIKNYTEIIPKSCGGWLYQSYLFQWKPQRHKRLRGFAKLCGWPFSNTTLGGKTWRGHTNGAF